jgi:hypothetical protein
VNRGHNEFAHVIEAWLDTTETDEDPRPLLDRVVARLDATPQRRIGWSLGTAGSMRNEARLAFAAATAVVVAFVGYQMLIATNPAGPNVGGGGTGPSPSGAASATPFLSGEARPTAGPSRILDFTGYGSITPGDRYIVWGREREVRLFSFSVPTDRWYGDQWVRIVKGGAEVGPHYNPALFYLAPPVPNEVYADPCTHTKLALPPLPSHAELAAALAAVGGIEVIDGPSTTSVGGYPATTLTLTMATWTDAPCEDFGLGDTLGPSDWPRNTFWIVDAGPDRFLFIAAVDPDAGTEIRQEIESIVDSIRFE